MCVVCRDEAMGWATPPDAERAAREIRDEANADEDAGPVELAHALMGEHAIDECHGLREKASYDAVRDRIRARSNLSRNALAYLVGHELAERFQRRAGSRLVGAAREALCDAVACHLIAPASLVRAALRAHGDDHGAVARSLRTTQTIALVRIAEITHVPTAAVIPGRIIVRGDEFAWPDEERMRQLEQGPVPAGVVRLPITDARRRFAIRAA